MIFSTLGAGAALEERGDGVIRSVDVVAWLGQLPAAHTPSGAAVPMVVSPAPCQRVTPFDPTGCTNPAFTPGKPSTLS